MTRSEDISLGLYTAQVLFVSDLTVVNPQFFVQTGQQGSVSYLDVTNLRTNETFRSDFSGNGAVSIVDLVVDNSSNEYVYLTTKERDSYREFKDIYTVYQYNIVTGARTQLLQSAEKLDVSQNPFLQLTTDVYNNVYVIKADAAKNRTLYKISIAPKGFTIEEDAFTKSLSSFKASDFNLKNEKLELAAPKSYRIHSIFPANDGSYYLLATTSGVKYPRLFVYNGSTGNDKQTNSKQPGFRDLSFVPITTGKEEVRNVVALSLTNALFQSKAPTARNFEWKAYQSGSGPITSEKNLELPISTTSIFSLNTIGDEQDFLAGVDQIAALPDGTLFKEGYSAGLESFNILSILPPNPSGLQDQIASVTSLVADNNGVSIDLIQVATSVYASVDSEDTTTDVYLGEIEDVYGFDIISDPAENLNTLYVLDKGQADNTARLRKLQIQWDEISRNAYIIKDDNITLAIDIASFGLATSTNLAVANPLAAKIDIRSNDDTSYHISAGPTSFSADILDTQSNLEQSIGDNSLLSAIPFASQSYQSTGYDAASFRRLNSGKKLGKETELYNTGYEIGIPLPGITVPTKTDFFEQEIEKGKKITRKDGFNVKGKDGGSANFEIELKGGPVSLTYQAADISKPNEPWNWSTTTKAEFNLKAKLKFGKPQLSSDTVKSQYKRPNWEEAKESFKKQRNIVNQERTAFTDSFIRTFQTSTNAIDILAEKAKNTSDSYAVAAYRNLSNDIKNQSRVAEQEFNTKNQAAAEKLKKAEEDYLKAVGAEQPSLEISANVAGAWTYEDLFKYNSENLRKFKLNAGVGFGVKIPLYSWQYLTLFYIMGIQANFVWEQKFSELKQVGTDFERSQLLSVINSDIVEAVTDKGVNISTLSPKQQRQLSNEQIFWRFKKSPLDYIPESLLSTLSTTSSLMEAAGLVMSYIPPVLFVTLLSQLTGSSPSGAIAQENDETNIITSLTDFASSSNYNDLRAKKNDKKENYYLTLLDEADPASLGIENALKETSNSFGYNIKLKELGLNANLSTGANLDLDVKGYIGAEFAHDITKQKLSFNVGVGIEAKLKFLFFSLPLSFYYTFYKYEKSPSQLADKGFYGSSGPSLQYQNLMGAENFSPALSFQLETPANTAELSVSNLSFLDIYTYDDVSNKSIGLYAVPVQVGTSKTGQIVDLYSISGFGSGSSTAWDPTTKSLIGRGFFTEAEIKGHSYWQYAPGSDSRLHNFPVVVLAGITENSPQFEQAVQVTSQISGSNHLYTVGQAGSLQETGSITPAESYAAAQYSFDTLYYKSTQAGGDNQNLHQVSSMPQYEYNSGGVVYTQLDQASLSSKTTFDKQSLNSLILQYNPAGQNRFGVAISVFPCEQLSASFLSVALQSDLGKSGPVLINTVDPALIPYHGIIDLANPLYGDYAFATNSGLSAAEGAFRLVQSAATNTAQLKAPNLLSTTQLVSFVDRDGGLNNSMVQVSTTDFGFVGDRIQAKQSQKNSFITLSSIDSSTDSNEFFSGSVAFNQSSDLPMAFVGGTGFANLIDFSANTSAESPFIALNQESDYSRTVSTQFTYEGYDFTLWIQLSVDPASFDWAAATLDNVAGVVIQAKESDLPASFNKNLADRILSTSSLTALNFSGDGGSVSFALNENVLKSAKSGSLDVQNSPTRLVENQQANVLSLRFSSIDQPLTTGFLQGFSANGNPQQKTEWIYAATNDSDGNSLLYLISDTDVINSVSQSAHQTLWLDPYSETPKSDLSFINGITGIAFSQGSTINTFTSDAGDNYLVIGDPYYRTSANALNSDGRVFMLKYDNSLLDFAKKSTTSKSRIPLVSPEEYLKKVPSGGSIIYGKQGDNGLFGSVISVSPSGSPENILSISSPGTFDTAGVSSLLTDSGFSSVVYGDRTSSDSIATTQQLTPAGKLIKSSLFYDNGKQDDRSNQQSLIYTVPSAPTSPGSQLLNEDIYSYPLYNMGSEKSLIKKDFDGVVSQMNLDRQYGGTENPTVNLVVTNSGNSKNYPMTTAVLSGSAPNQNNWSPLAVNWKAIETASGRAPAYELPQKLDDEFLAADIIIALDDANVTEGDNLAFTITKLTSDQCSYRVKLEDVTGYAGKDYEPIDRIDSFGESESKGYELATYDHSDFIGSRLVRIAVYSTEPDSLNQLLAYKNVQINSNDTLKLSTIGTGAAVKTTSSSQSVALAATGLADGWALLLNSNSNKDGITTSSSASLIPRSNKNYDTSNADKSCEPVKNFELPSSSTPVAVSLTPDSGTILYSMYDGTKEEQQLYALPGWGTPVNLNSQGSDFFTKNSAKILPEGLSPTFASTVLPFTCKGNGYVAVADSSFGKVYILKQETIQQLRPGASISIGDLAKQNGNVMISAGSDVRAAFGSSMTAGLIKGRNTLVIGAPYGNPNEKSNTPAYGGSVYVVDLDGLFSSGVKAVDLDPKTNKQVPALRIDGQTSVNLDPGSTGYLTGFGPSIGAAVEFARISSPTPQLLVGASAYMTGDLATGAVHVIDTTSIPLNPDSKATTVAPFNSLSFAYGQQTQGFTGHTFVGSDGDRLGSSIVNMAEYTGGYDLDRQVKDRDVIALASPSRFDSAGGVYIYIGNNNEPQTIATLNPTSAFEHAFQYAGTVSGGDPSFAIPPDTQIGINTNTIGKFSSPLAQSIPQGKDLAISVRGSQSPAAVLTYGKPYLYPGDTISVFDIDAGGFGQPVLGSGFPAALGDANLDGIGDYILYPSTLSGRTDKGVSLSANIEFGRSPTTLDQYDPRPWQVAPDSTYKLDRDLTFSSNGAGDGSSPVSSSAYSSVSAFNTSSELLRSMRVNYQPNIFANQTLYGVSFASGSYYPHNLGIISNIGFDLRTGAARISVLPEGSSQSKSVQVSPAASERFTYMAASSSDSSLLNAASDLLLSSVGATDGTLKIYSIAFDASTKPLQTLLYSQPLGGNFAGFTTNQISVAAVDSWSFEGSKYLLVGISATNKQASPSNPSYALEYYVVNATTGKSQLLYQLQPTTFSGATLDKSLWFDNLAWSASLSSLGDWNGDGFIDISFAKYDPNVQVGSNPFVNRVLYGNLEISDARSSSPSRYSLSYSNDFYQDIVPLSKQSPNIISSVGDVDGSGKNTLFASPLPVTDELKSKAGASSLVSFKLFPSDVLPRKAVPFLGTEGDDFIAIDKQHKVNMQNGGVVNTYQGSDLVTVDWDGIVSSYDPNLRQTLFASLGSGDDTFVINDTGLLLRAEFGASSTYYFDLFLDGGSGFDALSLGPNTNGVRQVLDLTLLLSRASGIEQINFIEPMSIDLERLNLSGSKFTGTAGAGLYFSANYGSRLTLQHSQGYQNVGSVAMNGLNYAHLFNASSKSSLYIQEGISLYRDVRDPITGHFTSLSLLQDSQAAIGDSMVDGASSLERLPYSQGILEDSIIGDPFSLVMVPQSQDLLSHFLLKGSDYSLGSPSQSSTDAFGRGLPQALF